MGTTSNGKPWGHNFGRAASGIFYGWSVKRGVEAAQRREAQEGESEWTTPVDAAKVAVLWVLFGGITIIQGYWILNATVMIVTGFFDPNRPHTTLLDIALGLLAIGISLAAILAARALLARAEHLPPKRGERFLRWRLFPKTWLALYIVPSFAYFPFYLAIR